MISKLEPTPETGMVDLGNKINEIIDYLEAKEEASKGECKKWCKHNQSLAGDEGYFRCNLCNPPESKGECPHLTMSAGRYLSREECPICNPPEHDIKSPDFDLDKFKKLAEEARKTFEHEEEWVKDFIFRFIDDKYPDYLNIYHGNKIIDYIRDNFVSKEKIKKILNEAEFKGDSGYCGKCSHIVSKLESLGLGE